MPSETERITNDFLDRRDFRKLQDMIARLFAEQGRLRHEAEDARRFVRRDFSKTEEPSDAVSVHLPGIS
jgi:hypothetical protein